MSIDLKKIYRENKKGGMDYLIFPNINIFTGSQREIVKTEKKGLSQ